MPILFQETVQRPGQEISNNFVPTPSWELMLKDLLISLKKLKYSVRWRYYSLKSDEIFDDIDTDMRDDND